MNTKEKISKIIDENDICLFMKGTPDSPQCGFSLAVSNVLKHLNVNLKMFTGRVIIYPTKGMLLKDYKLELKPLH